MSFLFENFIQDMQMNKKIFYSLILGSIGFLFTIQVANAQAGCIVVEDFESMPTLGTQVYGSYGGGQPSFYPEYYAWYWSSNPKWGITGIANHGNHLRGEYTNGSTGSSAVTLNYANLTPNTQYNIYIDMYQESCSQHWTETAYILGSQVNNSDREVQSSFASAKHFDDDGSNGTYHPNGRTNTDWTLVKKFDGFGSYPNNNGGNWTTYSKVFNSGNSNKITVGFKVGKGGGSTCKGRFDNLRICPVQAPTSTPIPPSCNTSFSTTCTNQSATGADIDINWNTTYVNFNDNSRIVLRMNNKQVDSSGNPLYPWVYAGVDKWIWLKSIGSSSQTINETRTENIKVNDPYSISISVDNKVGSNNNTICDYSRLVTCNFTPTIIPTLIPTPTPWVKVNYVNPELEPIKIYYTTSTRFDKHANSEEGLDICPNCGIRANMNQAEFTGPQAINPGGYDYPGIKTDTGMSKMEILGITPASPASIPIA